MFPAARPHLCVLTNLTLSLSASSFLYIKCVNQEVYIMTKKKKKMVRQKTEDPLITLHFFFIFFTNF